MGGEYAARPQSRWPRTRKRKTAGPRACYQRGMSLLRSRTILLLPLVLASVSLFEEVATYKVRQYVHDMPTRAFLVLALNGALFAVAADWIGPGLKRLLTSARTTSRRGGGAVGLWIFYSIAYG